MLLLRWPLSTALRALPLAAALWLPAAGHAQGGGNGPGTTAPQASAAPLSKGEIKAIREFQMLDFNGDGKLSRAEVAIIPRLAAAFDDADTDHDNYVTLDEVRAYAIKYRAERERARGDAAAQSSAEPKK